MMVDQAIGDDRLWSLLQGDIDPGEALLIATHCAVSEMGRKRLLELAQCAAKAMEITEPKDMLCTAATFFDEKCSKAKILPPPAPVEPCDVPHPLQQLIGKSYDDIDWHFVLPGMQEKRLKVRGSKNKLSLLNIKEGTQVPRHGHTGEEMTLVLCGSFEDGGIVYHKGDLSTHHKDAVHSHAPKVMKDCICLVLLEKPVYFTGFWGGLLNRFLT